MNSPCLSILGTGSDVGKSIVTTALCRIFYEKGIRVAPYKAQNMSNNSGITPEGLEMGRAQIVQSEACKIPPHVDMNPILLKPTSELGCQIVLLGKARENKTASQYHKKKDDLFKTACNALERLRNKHQLVIMEGAGSCAEVNLMNHDIVNFKIAEYANAPVILVADIHRGGVFAQIIGTLSCIPKKYQDLIAGFIINRFRGDINLLEDGVSYIQKRTGKPVFGVVPWFDNFSIDAEDSVVIESPIRINNNLIKQPAIAVIRIPHISNFTDFTALSAIDELNLYFIEKPQDLTNFHAIIIPGSKNTRNDLEWLTKTGWADIIYAYAKNNGHILGICGGYQMLGTYIHDPDGIESNCGSTKGLSLLGVETNILASKTTTITKFSWDGIYGMGYEIHMGETINNKAKSLFKIHSRNNEKCNSKDGALSKDKKIMGTYMHGLFDNSEILSYWLDSIGIGNMKIPELHGISARDKSYELLSGHFKKYVAIDEIYNILK